MVSVPCTALVATACRAGRSVAIVFFDGEPTDWRGAEGRTLSPAQQLARAYGTECIVTDDCSAARWPAAEMQVLTRNDVLAHFNAPSMAALCRDLSTTLELQPLVSAVLPHRSAAQSPRQRLPLFTAALGYAALGTHPSTP